MTQTLNGHHVTLGGDAQMRVRALENPVETPDSAPDAEESAFTHVHTRVIPDRLADDHARDGSSVRNFASQHGGEALHALRQSWLLTEVPKTAGEAWAEVLPRPGEASGKAVWLALSAAGVFRAVVVSFLHLILLAVDTRLRAGVALVLFVVIACGVSVACFL